MTFQRFPWREFVLLTLPCALLVFVGSRLARNLRARPMPTPTSTTVPVPTPTPATFWIELKRFGLEPVNPFNAQSGADTCVTLEVITHNAPPNMRWLHARRLVALKNGKRRVLWHDNTPGRVSPWLSQQGSHFADMQIENFLFKLRDVPTEYGEIIFAWDMLAQPARQNDTKWVSVAEIQRAAKGGGLRISKRLVVRRDGQKIAQPAFRPKPSLRVWGAYVKRLPTPEWNGNDVEIVLRLLYTGRAQNPRLYTEGGIALRDESWRDVKHAESDTVRRQGNGRIYTLSASIRSGDLRGVRHLRIEADVSDGKSLPLHAAAKAAMPAELSTPPK
ncbi:MAG: hypothetical protein M3347_00420 [Armatimonadota bacterium]|nr:hypothetical protein [Armatimonadota bacterium]